VLPAAQRLTSASSFREVVRRGHRCGGPLLVVHVLVPGDARGDASGEPARAGLVVSKAVGPAVTRTKVKRRLRHLVREHLAGLPAGSMVVLRAQPAAAEATYAALGEELARCLGTAAHRASERASERAGTARPLEHSG
jgi:ribonuclease P protein component